MAVQHTHENVTSTIIITGAETCSPTYMGCVGRIVGESWEEAEERWNAFAETMWQFGVEPTQDEPFFTIVDDGVVWDHYTLREIEQDGAAICPTVRLTEERND